MLRRILAGVGASVLAAVLVQAQAGSASQAPQQGGGRQGGGRQGRGGGGGGGGNYPTKEQWDAMPPSAKAYVDKATALAGSDPELQFDQSIFCQADGGASNTARASSPPLTGTSCGMPSTTRTRR